MALENFNYRQSSDMRDTSTYARNLQLWTQVDDRCLNYFQIVPESPEWSILDISTFGPKPVTTSRCDDSAPYPQKLDENFSSILNSGSHADQDNGLGLFSQASPWADQRQIWVDSTQEILQQPTPINIYSSYQPNSYFEDQSPANFEDCETVANSSWSTTPENCSPSTELFCTPPSPSAYPKSTNVTTPSSSRIKHHNNIGRTSNNQASQEVPSPPPQKEHFTTKTPSPPSYAVSKTKESHKMIEKKYRNRLNGYFGRLFAAVTKSLPKEEVDGKLFDRRVSKGRVLILAVEHIRALEMQCESLEKERKSLLADIEKLRGNRGGKANYVARR